MVKFIVFVALFVLTRAAAPVPHPGLLPEDLDYNPYAQYSFEYKAENPITGDFKTQFETRDGDVVKGKYSLVESDGSERVVKYIADAINGFNAVVSNSVTGTVSHGIVPGVVPISAPLPAKIPLPIAAKVLAPFAPVAPIAPIAPLAAKIVSPVAAKIAAPLVSAKATPYNYGHYGYPYAGYENLYNPLAHSYPHNAEYFPRYY